jgi:FtsP/CotA-like multicopper oxidase with cupredoxin domain
MKVIPLKKADNKLRGLFVTLAVLVLALAIVLTLLFLSDPQDDNDVTRNRLQIPPLLEDQNPDPGIAAFTLTAQEGKTSFYPDRQTATTGYNGSYLGPVIRIRRGQKVSINVVNQLAEPTTVHWHGLVVDAHHDGGPHQDIQPGASWQPEFTVDQPAATLWYHPHFTWSTANQVYDGLAGLIFIDDAVSDMLNLPDEYGDNDVPIIIQDRNFNQDGSFDYQTTMMGIVPGQTILVNGTVDPFLPVNLEKIRLRVLNGSNAQNFFLTLDDGSSFLQIASDGGFLPAPVSKKELFLSPGERAEIIIDFAGDNKRVKALLQNQKTLLTFAVSETVVSSEEIPATLTFVEDSPVGQDVKMRQFDLESMGISGTINGKYFDMNRVDEEVALNTTELWTIRNLGGMMQSGGHPFHVHGTQFQIVSRDGRKPPAEEQGYKDTVYVAVGEVVVIKVRFTRTGLYMYHCHILEHEDNGMMGQFLVK